MGNIIAPEVIVHTVLSIMMLLCGAKARVSMEARFPTENSLLRTVNNRNSQPNAPRVRADRKLYKYTICQTHCRPQVGGLVVDPEEFKPNPARHYQQ